MNRMAHFRSVICISVSVVGSSALQAAPTVWNGPQISFSKPAGANPSLAANQDRMTADIWLTRGSSQGLFNANDESGFAHFSSPAGTEWANGSLANFSSLSFTDWNHWAKGINAGPPSTVGVNAVLHLIPDDIYLSIKFTSWSSGGTGGGFSYLRSTAVVPEPSTALLSLTGFALLAMRRLSRWHGRSAAKPQPKATTDGENERRSYRRPRRKRRTDEYEMGIGKLREHGFARSQKIVARKSDLEG